MNNTPKFHSLRANDPNSDVGPRNAAVLTFSGNTNDSMIKELTQNSLDARCSADLKLIIRIRLEKIIKSSIPDFSSFERMLETMSDYYKRKGNQYKEFFSQALRGISEDVVNVLVFEDFNTKGLSGDDKTEGSFKSCVNDDNISSKDSSDSLGNHGIGKNSVFGYSSIQTVFYSSLNVDNEYKFKGVSKLGTYRDERGIHRSEKIYYGIPRTNRDGSEEVLMVDDYDAIPEVFRRHQPGLSQYVISAEADAEWTDTILSAFINNYWFLLENDKLEVTVDDKLLGKSNYLEIAERLFADDTSQDNPLPFIRAYKAGICAEREIHNLGKVCLYLLEAEEGERFPNKIQFLRDGMKIKLDSPGVGGLPAKIAGVMFCTDKTGNTILGAMEPHAHDRFMPDLVEKKGAPNGIDKRKAQKILDDLRDFRIHEIRKIKDKYGEAVESVDLVDDLFSALLSGSRTGAGGSKLTHERESFERKNRAVDFRALFASSEKSGPVRLDQESEPVGDGAGSEAGDGEGGKGLRSGNSINAGSEGGGERREGPRSTKNRKNITARFFLLEKGSYSNRYKLILRSNEPVENGVVIIGQHGDAAGNGIMGSELVQATSEGAPVPVEPIRKSNGDVLGYALKELAINDIRTLELEFRENRPSAFQLVETK
jgi:hypothetical protein